MKKLFLGILLFLIMPSITFGALASIGSLYGEVTYSINFGDDIYYIANGTESRTTHIFDKSGTLIKNIVGCKMSSGANYTRSNSSSSAHTIIDTQENVYIFQYNGSTHQNQCVFKINKTTKSISENRLISINDPGATFTYWSGTPYIMMDENNLVYYNGGTYKSIDINDTSANLLINSYTGSLSYTSMPNLYGKYYYRASQNNLSYLHEANQTLDYYIKDQAGDIIHVQDVFVSLWNMDGRNMLRRDVDTQQFFYLSIYGEEEATSGLDYQRVYNEYELGNTLEVEGTYYTQLVNNDTLFEIDVLDNTYDFRYGIHKPFIEVIDVGAGNQIYFLDRGTDTLYKEIDIDLSDFLVDISQVGVSSSSSSSSSGGSSGTATGSYIGVDFDDSVFDFDIDGDGEVGVLNGEIFLGIGNVIKAFFSKIVDFFANLRGLLNKFSDAFTTEEKDFSFIPSANAQETLGEMLNNNVDQGEYEENTLGKINIFIKGFIAFLVFVIGFAVFIGISKSKNG